MFPMTTASCSVPAAVTMALMVMAMRALAVADELLFPRGRGSRCRVPFPPFTLSFLLSVWSWPLCDFGLLRRQRKRTLWVDISFDKRSTNQFLVKVASSRPVFYGDIGLLRNVSTVLTIMNKEK